MKKLVILYFAICILSCDNKNSQNQITNVLDSNSPEYMEESSKIMDVINEEFKAYYVKDYEAWQSKFIHQDYLKYWGYWEGYPEKVRQYNSWEELNTDKKKRMAGEIKAYWDENVVGNDIRDLNVQIRGDVAWVTFRQRSTDQETGELLGNSLETKILEKENGEWKIAYINFIYLPLDTINN